MMSDKSTIFFLSSSSGPGGAERILAKLAASIDGERFRCVVGLFRSGWLQEECHRQGVATHMLPSPGSFDPGWVRTCLKFVHQQRIALIHSHEFDANVHGALVARLAGIPQIATIHGKHYYWEKPRRRFAYRLVSRWAKMVTVSEDLRRFVSTKVGIPPERLLTVYNGVELLPDVDSSAVALLRKELGIAGDDRVLGTVGSLYPVKGHRFFLEALPQVFQTCPRSTVLIVGRGELESSLKDQAKRLGLQDRVLFLGLRQDIPRLLAVMDVFVMPSLSEGLSIALLEAMAARKAVIATSVGGNPELVRHGETGYLVSPENSADLGAALSTLLSDPDKIRAFGQAGRTRVESDFSLTTMVSRYEALYERALSGR
jgi:glycosyltransferase involved in cell wall biosynthesis